MSDIWSRDQGDLWPELCHLRLILWNMFAAVSEKFVADAHCVARENDSHAVCFSSDVPK